MEELIAKRYAKALSSVHSDIRSSTDTLSTLAEVVNTSEIKTVLNSPMIDSQKKTDMILSGLNENTDKTLVNFIKILGENKRLDMIPSIAKVLSSDLQKASNKYEGVLRSKVALDSDALNELEVTLKKYTGSTISLKQEQSDKDDLRVAVDDLGIEVNFSKQRVKEQLIDFIKKSL